MKFTQFTMRLIFLILLTTFIYSCSGSNSPINPQLPLAQNNLAISDGTSLGRSIMAVYNAAIDPQSKKFSVEPIDRTTLYHLPLTNYYPNVLAITGYGFTPNFWANIRLKHPFPGSGIAGFDPRVIAIIPANDGVSFFYPVFNVKANNKALMDPPDGYTPLWDSLGGSIPGNANPFRAYFKDQPYRVWWGKGKTEETQKWNINLSGFGGPIQFKLVVDISTNYPNTPQPMTDNAPEPVDISTTIGTGMTSAGGSAPIEVTFLDWQGYANIKCKVESPDLFANAIQLAYSRPGTNPNEWIFTGTIPNDNKARGGSHKVLIAAWDIPTGVHIYDEAVANVDYSWGAWHPDPNRTNVDLSKLSEYYPPRSGSDLGVIDCADTSINGVMMYEPTEMVVRLNLDLTTCNVYGDSYYPQDNDPNNPHPNPDYFPTARIDGADNGYVVQSWNDGHYGAGPDLKGHFQREDSLIGIMQPNAGWLEFCIGAIPNMADNSGTPQYDESAERPRLTDVYDEFDIGEGKYVLSGIWSGTVVWDSGTGNTFHPIGVMGGIKQPYYNPPFITMDWGLWIFTGPPTDEIVAADASQDYNYPFQYWGYSGDFIGPAVVGVYDKYGGTITYITMVDPNAKLLDLQLIPKQDPPLNVGGIPQLSDWIAVLLDNKTIEIIDPTYSHGQVVEIIDVGLLIGNLYYLDIANHSGDIFISHSDGTKAFCTVFTVH